VRSFVTAVGEEEREARELPLDDARQRVEAEEVGAVADLLLAQELGVVGDGGEVERPGEPEDARRLAFRVIGLHAERLAAREAVGVARHG
jgi:hypothetical protein